MCVLGILLAIMLCMPVALAADSYSADKSEETGSWSFYVITDIQAYAEVKLNGQGDPNCPCDRTGVFFHKVIVPASLDKVEVQFVVTAGTDTTITVTKDYIAKLQRAKPDEVPTIYAWGGLRTYDVDACGGSEIPNEGWTSYLVGRHVPVFVVTVYEHLVERGLYHHNDPDYQYTVDFKRSINERRVTA